MNAGEKEVVDLMTKWKDEIKQLSSDYAVAIGSLDKARSGYEMSWIRKFAPIISPILVAILVVVVVIVLNKNIAWCSLKFQGLEVTNQKCAVAPTLAE